MTSKRRPALLRRFPALRYRPVSWPAISPGTVAKYPALAEDIAFVESVVAEPFAESDWAALERQNRFRRQQVGILVGTAILSGLGGLQAVFLEQSWPGWLLVGLGLVLTAVGRTAGELGMFDEFLSERVKAERLRALQFRYLSRTGRYAGPDRQIVLKRAAVAIKNGEEPS